MNEAPIFDPESGEVIETGDDRPPFPAVMSLDEARALLVREHDTAIGADDPLLMSVTLHQGFLRDYEGMLTRHDETIKSILGATGEACAEAVEKTLEGLKDRTVKASLEQAFALVSEQAKNMETLNRSMRRHRMFSGMTTFVSVVACVLSFSILFAVLK